MTPPTRADEQRRRVLAVSTDVFARRGFRATSMNEIAAGVGVSKPTLYHYFRSKEEILVRIYSEVLDESLAAAQATVAAAATPFDAVRALISSTVAYTCRHQQLLTVCFEEEHELPVELSAKATRAAIEDLFLDALTEHLARHPEIHLETSPKVLVNAWLGAASWTYRWYRHDGGSSPEELGEQMADVLVAGIRPLT